MVRLVPEIPLPPYTFVPGCPHPHPNHPGGHSYGMLREPDPLDPARWWECRTYLYGFDLFNGPVPGTTIELQPESPECSAGYYWESHESWEGLWHAAGRRGPIADFLKGLIHLAAAGVKHREGVPAGVVSHAARAAVLWRGIAAAAVGENGLFLGLSLAGLIDLAERVAREGWPHEWPQLLPILPADR